MRSKFEILNDFRKGDDNSANVHRERAMLEVLFDVRDLLERVVSLEEDEKNWRDTGKVV